MPEKPEPTRLLNPKSDKGLARSAEALRENLLKRKAQKRARTELETRPQSDKASPDEAG